MVMVETHLRVFMSGCLDCVVVEMNGVRASPHDLRLEQIDVGCMRILICAIRQWVAV